jgi:hypothetical protein
MNILFGCKLTAFLQSFCSMSDQLCLREGRVFAPEAGMGAEAQELDRLKADFAELLKRHPSGLPLTHFKQAYEEFFHRPLKLVRT